MATPPGHAITPSLSQMSRTVAEIFNRWAISARASYELVLGAIHSTKQASLTNLALKGRIFEVPIVLALSKRSNPLFADYSQDNDTWTGTLLTYESKLAHFMVSQAMQVN